MADTVVIGSANMDTVYSVAHIPAPGETIISGGVMLNAGGKGANRGGRGGQAGRRYRVRGRRRRRRGGRCTPEVADRRKRQYIPFFSTSHEPTGSAFICVADSGENSIVVYPGANACVSAAMIDAAELLIAAAKVCVMQLEVPHETVWHAVEVCKRHNVKVLLNPSPAADIPDEVLAATDILVPNEHEAEALMGCTPDGDALKAYCARKGIGRIVMTMGSHGVWNATCDEAIFYPCKKAVAVDTGAGGLLLGCAGGASGERPRY